MAFSKCPLQNYFGSLRLAVFTFSVLCSFLMFHFSMLPTDPWLLTCSINYSINCSINCLWLIFSFDWDRVWDFQPLIDLYVQINTTSQQKQITLIVLRYYQRDKLRLARSLRERESLDPHQNEITTDSVRSTQQSIRRMTHPFEEKSKGIREIGHCGCNKTLPRLFALSTFYKYTCSNSSIPHHKS